MGLSLYSGLSEWNFISLSSIYNKGYRLDVHRFLWKEVLHWNSLKLILNRSRALRETIYFIPWEAKSMELSSNSELLMPDTEYELMSILEELFKF